MLVSACILRDSALVIELLVDDSAEELTVEDNLVDNVFVVCCDFLWVACLP